MRFGGNINYLWKMKELILITLLFCSAFNVKAQNNLILNGSFEINSINPCFIGLDLFNYISNISYSTLYAFEAGFHQDSCLRCIPSTYWGGGAKEGNWFGSIGSVPHHNTVDTVWKNSKLSLQLISSLSNSKNYKLSFYIKEPPDIPLNTTGCQETPSNYINIGISNSATNFGTHVYTSPIGLNADWQQYSIVFNPQNAEEHLTIEAGTGDTNYFAVLIDDFVLEETTEPVSVNEVNNNNRQLLKIVDVLGKESSSNKKGLLFYIYTDGTVEKKLIIE